MTPREFIRGFIQTHEGGLSLDPVDTGNTFYEKGKPPVLVGSKFGVTGAALAQFRGVTHITPADIANLTLDEAVSIGISIYYDKPDYDLLPWNQVTASIVDMAWGAGTRQAAKLLQRMVGAADDGSIGQRTAALYGGFLSAHGLDSAAQDWAIIRDRFYDQIIQVNPANAKYRRGWRARTASFLPGTDWWRKW